LNKESKITIITVTKNSEKYLEENILSVFNQTYKNYEHIIIDGASKDGTVEIIKRYQKNIKYFISERDDGLYHAMNKGIQQVEGDIIGILNADDFYYPNALEIVKKYLRTLITRLL